jgi:segregation and condensation protein B
MTPHATQLEALLFFKGEPTPVKDIASSLSLSEADVAAAAEELRTQLEGQSRGIRLMKKDDAYMLATAPELSSKIEKLIRDELEKDLGRAGLETLAIVIYYGPVTRAKIDYICGVNSTFTLRQLFIRGLIERIDNLSDQRSFLYSPTFQLLSYLGVTDVSQLPEFLQLKTELSEFEARENEPAAQESPAPPSPDA